MSPPRVFRAPPLNVRGVSGEAGGVRNAPLQVRGVYGPGPNMGGLPGPNGGPGSNIWPYSEGSTWGTTNPGVLANVAPPFVGEPPGPDSGEVHSDWINSMTYATVPLNSSNLVFGASTAVLTTNLLRASLIIQNNSTATSPDIAPTIYIGFNSDALVGMSLALVPGLGFFWSMSDMPPRDTIYVTIGPFSGAVLIQGCVIQGTYIPGQTSAKNIPR